MFFRSKQLIEFRCTDENFGVIPKPFPSSRYQPAWYKKLKHRVIDDGSKEKELLKTRFYTDKSNQGKQCQGFNTSTIKRCPPVIEAISAGWIIPLAQDVHIRSNKDCSMLRWEWQNQAMPMIEEHGPSQIGGPAHPMYPKWPFKWMNHWSIKTPPGWSVMFLDPLDRQGEQPFICFQGFVETDKYPEYINFPFFWTVPDFNGVLPAGTPLVQIIPFKREAIELEADFHAFTEQDLAELRHARACRQVHESYYRDQLWRKGKLELDV